MALTDSEQAVIDLLTENGGVVRYEGDYSVAALIAEGTELAEGTVIRAIKSLKDRRLIKSEVGPVPGEKGQKTLSVSLPTSRRPKVKGAAVLATPKVAGNGQPSEVMTSAVMGLASARAMGELMTNVIGDLETENAALRSELKRREEKCIALEDEHRALKSAMGTLDHVEAFLSQRAPITL